MAQGELEWVTKTRRQAISAAFEKSGLSGSIVSKESVLASADHYLEIISRLAASTAPPDNFIKLKLFTGRLGTWAEGLYWGEDLPHRADFIGSLKKDSLIPGYQKLDEVVGTISDPDPGRPPLSLLETWSWEFAIISHEHMAGAYINFLDGCARTIFPQPPVILNPHIYATPHLTT